jgi:hypothetical protein
MFWVIEAVSGRTLTACGADGQAVDKPPKRDPREWTGRSSWFVPDKAPREYPDKCSYFVLTSNSATKINGVNGSFSFLRHAR